MRQLHIREPWADLAYRTGEGVIDDLVTRIQMLEARVKELEDNGSVESKIEELESVDPASIRETISVGNRESIAVGV